jgi:hypothetical protein
MLVLLAVSMSRGTTQESVLKRQPPLYIVSMMHAEDRMWFKESRPRFTGHAENLRRLTNRFHAHGAKLAFQPDWTFIAGAEKWDPGLFTWLLDRGMGVDAHTHANHGYTLEKVADMLKACGVPQVRVGNGHFDKPVLFGMNMFWAFSQPQKETGKPYFEAICAYKDSTTGEVDRSQIVWRPRQSGDWHVHDPKTPVFYIGGGPMGALKSFVQLEEVLRFRLPRVEPGYTNVMYWHDSLHNYPRSRRAAERIEQWDRFLGEVIDPLAASGKVRWATFSEILDAYLALEQSGASALEPGDEIPQVLGPGHIDQSASGPP